MIEKTCAPCDFKLRVYALRRGVGGISGLDPAGLTRRARGEGANRSFPEEMPDLIAQEATKL
jgi:hypothetical protein